MGIDVGFTYSLTENLNISGSFLDLGAIFHTSDTENYEASGDYTLNGLELIFPPLDVNQETFPYYNNLEDEIEREIPYDTISKSYVHMRPLKVNAALSYSFD